MERCRGAVNSKMKQCGKVKSTKSKFSKISSYPGNKISPSRFPETRLHTFFYKQHFKSSARLKLAKNQANVKEHPEAELLLLEHISHSSFTLSSKNIRKYSKNISKKTNVSVFMRLIIIKMKMKTTNRSHRYSINRPRSRHGHKYSKYKKCLSMMMLIRIKQHLSKT